MSDTADEMGIMADGLDRVADAARFLKVSPSSVYNLMGRGRLPYVKIGKSRRIPRRSLVAFAAANLVSRPAN